MALKKADLIKILVEEYGYEKEDIKLLTNAKLQGMIKQEELDAEELAHAETALIAKETGIKDDDKIVVMNGLSGYLTHKSKSTGRIWKFSEFGQTDKLPYSEILAIHNNNPKVFKDCWLIVLNKQIQEDFGLVEIYKNIITPENLGQLFDKPLEELEDLINNLPDGMKAVFIERARELYISKQLYDLRIIRFIENKFGFSLEDNAPISDIIDVR